MYALVVSLILAPSLGAYRQDRPQVEVRNVSEAVGLLSSRLGQEHRTVSRYRDRPLIVSGLDNLTAKDLKEALATATAGKWVDSQDVWTLADDEEAFQTLRKTDDARVESTLETFLDTALSNGTLSERTSETRVKDLLASIA
ncbi:MAG: hypothetical protein KF884_06270 [Fimbriimonadaceae bacterium]|nr:hypothetical protein [Fimbriimonadaceae bacterium]QYK59690.1 MAG: hypothetical protein KF884_06270 [Fimbriimonadaceae bacterium]